MIRGAALPTITPRVAAEVVEAMASGLSRSAAARRVGVSTSTVGGWLGRGAAGQEPYAELLVGALRRRGVVWSGIQRPTDLLLCHARDRRLHLPRATWESLASLGDRDATAVVVQAIDQELQRRSMAPEAVEAVA